MKKLLLMVLALSLTIALFSIANAGYKNGPGGGCGACAQQPEASNQVRQFQADSLDLRQEMMTKRFEAQRENLKATPDPAKIALLKAEIGAIQTKIRDLRAKSGLPACPGEIECGKRCGGADSNSMGGCGNSMGGCGNGMGGCGMAMAECNNSAPCRAQK